MPNPFYKNNTWTQETDSGGYKKPNSWGKSGANTPGTISNPDIPSTPYGMYNWRYGNSDSSWQDETRQDKLRYGNRGYQDKNGYYSSGASKVPYGGFFQSYDYQKLIEDAIKYGKQNEWKPGGSEDEINPDDIPGNGNPRGGGGGGPWYNPMIAPVPGVSPAIDPYNIEQPDYTNPYLNFTNPYSNFTNPWQQIMDNAKDPGYANTYGALRDEFKKRQEAEYNTRADAIAKRLNATNEAYDAQQRSAEQQAQSDINANEVGKFRALRNLDESQANRGIRESGQARQENLMANAKYDSNRTAINNNLQSVINNIATSRNQASADAEAEKYNARNAMDTAITEYNNSNMAEERQMQNQYQQYLQELANYALDYDTKMRANEAQYDANYRSLAEQYDINNDERNKDLQVLLEKLRLQAQAEQDQRDKDYQQQLALMNLKYGYYK